MEDVITEVSIAVTSINGLFPISQASIWHYPRAPKDPPVFLAFSDYLGMCHVKTDPTRIRVLARGFVPGDSISNRDFLKFGLLRNHPASYTGFLADAESAVWKRVESSGPVFQFTAFGLMRSADDLASLRSAPMSQYHLASRGAWFWGNEEQLGSNSRDQKREPPAEAEPLRIDPIHWSWLGRREHSFPQNEAFRYKREQWAMFRFPGPGRMIVRSTESLEETEFELVG